MNRKGGSMGICSACGERAFLMHAREGLCSPCYLRKRAEWREAWAKMPKPWDK